MPDDVYDLSLFEFALNRLRYPNMEKLLYLGHTFTEEDFLAEVYRIREYLQNSNINRGDVVSFILPNIPSLVFGIYGASANGCIASLIMPQMSIKELRETLIKTKTKLVFVWDYLINDVKDILCKLQIEFVVCSMSDYAGARFLPEISKYAGLVCDNMIQYTDLPYQQIKRKFIHTNGSSPAVYLHTGGTVSGKPKTVVLSARNINILFKSRNNNDSFPPPDLINRKSALVMLPIPHSLALTFLCANIPFHGRKVVMLPTELTHMHMRIMKEFKIYSMCGVPYTYEKMLQLGGCLKDACATLKYCYCAGGVPPENLSENLNRLLDNHIKVFFRYGGTEFMCGTWSEIVYYPHPVQGTYYIKDINSNNFLEVNMKGEILIDSKNVMLEYLGEGDKSAAFICIDGKRYVRTGDVGYLDQDARMHFVDRLKRVEKICGNNVYPSQVEKVIKNIQGIVNCVVARKHYKNGRPFLAAYMELVKGNTIEDIPKDKICEQIFNDLGKYSVPREFIVLDKIKKTAVGKNDYRYYEQ